MKIIEIAKAITAIAAALTVLGGMTGALLAIAAGVKCLLRHNMLHTYYRHRDDKEIRQYELEDFNAEFKAYRTLRGNSFIVRINEEVQTWKVIS